MKSAGFKCWRLGRFSMVGSLGAILQLVLLYAMTKWLHIHEIAAAPMAVEAVLLHNFVWHERFTWRGHGVGGVRQKALRLWRFHAGNGLISLFGNTVLTWCFVERLRAPVLLSAIAAIAICSLVNFFLADRWIYA